MRDTILLINSLKHGTLSRLKNYFSFVFLTVAMMRSGATRKDVFSLLFYVKASAV